MERKRFAITHALTNFKAFFLLVLYLYFTYSIRKIHYHFNYYCLQHKLLKIPIVREKKEREMYVYPKKLKKSFFVAICCVLV